jgi:undecaprenyl-diphosphatase
MVHGKLVFVTLQVYRNREGNVISFLAGSWNAIDLSCSPGSLFVPNTVDLNHITLYFLISSGGIFLMLVLHVIGTLILFAGVIAALVFTVREPMRRYKPLDLAIFDRIHRLVGPQTNRLMLFITFLGKHQFLIPANLLLILYFLFISRQTWFSIRVTAIALSSLVLMFLLKWLFKRKRPLSPLLKAARGLSFPSGHAIMAVSFFGLVVYCILHSIVPQWLKIAFTIFLVILILLIGFSRIYLRVHYASDVIAGFIVGLVWLLISLLVIDQVEEYSMAHLPVLFLISQWQPTYPSLTAKDSAFFSSG